LRGPISRPKPSRMPRVRAAQCISSVPVIEQCLRYRSRPVVDAGSSIAALLPNIENARGGFPCASYLGEALHRLPPPAAGNGQLRALIPSYSCLESR
jgi:hypothetical protein